VLAQYDNDVLILDVVTGKLLRRHVGPKESIEVFASFTGKTSDYWISSPGTVTLFDGASLSPRVSVNQIAGFAGACDLTPDGKRIAVSTGAGVSVHDTRTGERLLKYGWNNKAGSGALFTSDGKKLVAVNYELPGMVLTSSDSDPRLLIPVKGIPFGDLDIQLK
jgi:hypothetical protein